MNCLRVKDATGGSRGEMRSDHAPRRLSRPLAGRQLYGDGGDAVMMTKDYILTILGLVALFALAAWWEMANYHECRDVGFSIRYCISQMGGR